MSDAGTPVRVGAGIGLALVVGCVAVLGLGTGAAGGAPAAPPGNWPASDAVGSATELSVAGGTVDRAETTRLRVALEGISGGLAGYEIDLQFETAGVANVTGASYPDAFAHTTEPAIADDGQSVTLEAVDLDDEVRPASTDVGLATLTVTGVDDGETAVHARDVQLDADDGARIDPTVEPGTVVVEPVGAPAGASAQDDAGSAASTDRADGDGSRLLGVGVAVVLLAGIVGVALARSRR